jgi:hypothetical protein
MSKSEKTNICHPKPPFPTIVSLGFTSETTLHHNTKDVTENVATKQMPFPGMFSEDADHWDLAVC